MVIPSPRVYVNLLEGRCTQLPPFLETPPRAMGIDAWEVVVIGDDKSRVALRTWIKLQMTALCDTCSIRMYLWEPLRFLVNNEESWVPCRTKVKTLANIYSV